MKNLLFVPGLVCCALLAQAQVVNYGQQLEAVHSVKSAQAFAALLKQKHEIELDSSGRWQQESCFVYQVHSDSIDEASADKCVRYRIEKVPVWAKADFDKDGRADILLVDESGRAYCILNRGAGLPSIFPLMLRGWTRDCRQYTLIQVGGVPAVVHWNISYVGARNREWGHEPKMWRDTLVYHAGTFVEYTVHTQNHWPDSIQFTVNNSDPTRTYYLHYLVDLRAGRVHRESDIGSPSKANLNWRVLDYKLDALTLDTLRQRAAYLDTARLQSGYSIATYDAARAEIAFSYYPAGKSAGIKKVVEDDYGMVGTYGLAGIYSLIEDTDKRQQAKKKATTVPNKAGKKK